MNPFFQTNPTGNVSTPTPVTDLAIYVATTGNDTNDGLTAATPLLTVQAAVKLAGKLGWTSSCIVNLGAGTYDVWPDANGDTLVLPQGYGDNCGPICFKGATTDSGLGVLVATGGTAGVFGTTWQAATTSSVGVPADNTLRGYFAVFAANTTTAALRGHVVPIAKQTTVGPTTTWMFGGKMATAPVAGDTFTVVKPASIVRTLSGSAAATGATSLWQWIQFVSTVASGVVTASVTMLLAASWVGDGSANRASIRARAGGVIDIGGSRPTTLLALPAVYLLGVSGQQPGCYFNVAGVFTTEQGVWTAARCVFNATNISNNVQGSTVVVGTSYATGAGSILVGSGSTTLNDCEFDTCTGSSSGCFILVRYGAIMSISACNIHNCTAATAVVGIDYAAVVYATNGNFGASNAATYAVTVGHGSRFQCDTTTPQFTAATPGSDISIDGGTAISWATAITYPTLYSGAPSNPPGLVKGDILTYDGSSWSRVAGGAVGTALLGQGAGQLPAYGAVATVNPFIFRLDPTIATQLGTPRAAGGAGPTITNTTNRGRNVLRITPSGAGFATFIPLLITPGGAPLSVQGDFLMEMWLMKSTNGYFGMGWNGLATAVNPNQASCFASALGTGNDRIDAYNNGAAANNNVFNSIADDANRTITPIYAKVHLDLAGSFCDWLYGVDAGATGRQLDGGAKESRNVALVNATGTEVGIWFGGLAAAAYDIAALTIWKEPLAW